MSSTDQNRSAASAQSAQGAKPVPGPDIFVMLRQAALAAIAAEQQPGGLLADHPGNLAQAAITVEPPRDAGHGEAVCNAAMVLGASLNIAPRPLAEALASRLASDPRIASARMAGPGFINLTLEPGEWRGLLPAILTAGQGYGRADLGQGARVCVEFVGAYPVAPLQLAHLRGAVVGDAIARLLPWVPALPKAAGSCSARKNKRHLQIWWIGFMPNHGVTANWVWPVCLTWRSVRCLPRSAGLMISMRYLPAYL